MRKGGAKKKNKLFYGAEKCVCVCPLLEWVHPQGNVHTGAVGQEGCQSRLSKHSKNENPIAIRAQVGE